MELTVLLRSPLWVTQSGFVPCAFDSSLLDLLGLCRHYKDNLTHPLETGKGKTASKSAENVSAICW